MECQILCGPQLFSLEKAQRDNHSYSLQEICLLITCKKGTQEQNKGGVITTRRVRA